MDWKSGLAAARDLGAQATKRATDSLAAAKDKGAEFSKRTAAPFQLSMQKSELERKRADLYRQLGERLYGEVKGISGVRAICEDTFRALEANEVEMAQVDAEIARIEEEKQARAAEQAAQAASRAAAASAASAPAPVASGLACANCGQPFAEGDVFCMHCGTKA